MAKWGEGDPRWLVEERPDATNVNNWHWAEKDATAWSINKLTWLLVGTEIESEFAKCFITKIKKCEGEAVANNRKGKILVFYEWQIELEWTGTNKNSGEKSVKGRIEIPNLSDEREIKDVDISVYLDNTGEVTDSLSNDMIKNLMKTTGVGIIQIKLGRYISSLQEELSVGLILPTKDNHSISKCGPPKLHFRENEKKMKEKCSSKSSTGSEADTAEFESTETFKCTAEEFYKAMTDRNILKLVTQGFCVVDAKPNGMFDLFDGNVTGRFVELVENQLIVQKWRFSTWPEKHFSDVHLKISQRDDCTEVTLTHKGIPKSQVENTRDGWKRYFWDSMKRNLGFGAILI